MISPIFRAFSISPSSSYTPIVASAAATPTGWLLYVSPPPKTLSSKCAATCGRIPSAPSGT